MINQNVIFFVDVIGFVESLSDQTTVTNPVTNMSSTKRVVQLTNILTESVSIFSIYYRIFSKLGIFLKVYITMWGCNAENFTRETHKLVKVVAAFGALTVSSYPRSDGLKYLDCYDDSIISVCLCLTS